MEVLGRFLRRLGVAPDQVPTDEAESAALFRSVTVERRLLVVLDNAAGKDQVAPLVPASATCAVVVTSRVPLASLDADHRVRLGVLSDVDGQRLLAGITERFAVADRDAQAILGLTGGLPLAIRIAAGRLACRPDLSAAEYAARLADRSRRLDELELGDLAVRASIRTSYDALESSSDPMDRLAARAFRMLGLLHVPDVAPGVVAAMLAERNVETARLALERLVDAQLLETIAAGRYRLHDLIRLIATERATEEEPANRHVAVDSALEYYTGALHHADQTIRPGRIRLFGDPCLGIHTPLPFFEGHAAARRWVNAELPSLKAVLQQTVGMPNESRRLVLWLSHPLWNSLDLLCDWHASHRLSQLVLDTARVCKDIRMTACGHLLHGRSEACLGNHDGAIHHFELAADVMRDLGYQDGTLSALNGLGVVHAKRGEHSAALLSFNEALDVARDSARSGPPGTVVVLLNNMSVSLASLGRLENSEQAIRQSMALCLEEGDAQGLTTALINRAFVACLRGDLDLAARYADDALVLALDAGDRLRECEDRVIRAEVSLRLGDFANARADADRAYSLGEACGYRFVAVAAQSQRARIWTAMGSGDGATETRAHAQAAYDQLTGAFWDPMIRLVLAQADPMWRRRPRGNGAEPTGSALQETSFT